MAYTRHSDATPISAETVQMLAGVMGLTIPAEDLDALATSLTNQLASIALLDGLDLGEVDPLPAFDPRWHD
jgi:hypothetical protein